MVNIKHYLKRRRPPHGFPSWPYIRQSIPQDPRACSPYFPDPYHDRLRVLS